MTVYLSSAYLAPVEYYTKLLAYGQVYIEQHDHYTKQTYRNRCTIAAPDGALALSIPTVKPDTLKCPMRDIRISDHGNWRHLHWNAIESAYNHTPFFEYYKDDFRPFYEKRYGQRPRPLSHRYAMPAPQSGSPWQSTQSSSLCQGLSLWERWICEAKTERASP